MGFTEVRNASRLFIGAPVVDFTDVVEVTVGVDNIADAESGGDAASGAGNEATRSACGVNLGGTDGKR